MATMSINATERVGTSLRARLSVVPWLTVVPLAVVLSYADGFWMIALRGAVGSIERTGEPFASWLRESTLALPVFALAVFVALRLAHWLRPPLPTWKTPLATALLVVAAGTMVGIAELAVSSAYDNHLQSSHLQGSMAPMGTMGTMAPMGTTTAQEATLALQVRSVAYGSGLLLVTNLVLVGWVVAMRGGRLNVSTTDQARITPSMSSRQDCDQSRWA